MAQKAFALLCIMDFAWKGQDSGTDKSLTNVAIWPWEDKKGRDQPGQNRALNVHYKQCCQRVRAARNRRASAMQPPITVHGSSQHV